MEVGEFDFFFFRLTLEKCYQKIQFFEKVTQQIFFQFFGERWWFSLVQSVKKTPKQKHQVVEGTTVNLGPVLKKISEKNWMISPGVNIKVNKTTVLFSKTNQDVLQTAQDGAP